MSGKTMSVSEKKQGEKKQGLHNTLCETALAALCDLSVSGTYPDSDIQVYTDGRNPDRIPEV